MTRLALACGRWDITAFQAELSSVDLDWWLAYWNVEAFGVEDLHAARTLSALSEIKSAVLATRGVKSEPQSVADCMTTPSGTNARRPAQTDMSGEDVGKALMKAFGFQG